VRVSLTGHVPAFVDYVSVSCVLAVGCGVVDVAFARARFVASLWLTRSEQLAEARRDFGAPEIRRARAEARRAMQGAAP
jgi:flagellar biosynthesis protein FlhB